MANFSAIVANISISLASSQPRTSADGTPAVDSMAPQPQIRTLVLKAHETQEVVFDGAAGQSGLQHSIVVKSDQMLGLVQSKIVSRGNGTLYEVELLGKNLEDTQNGGGHPWAIDGETESHLLLFNPTGAANVFTVHIIAGATNWTKKYTLAPNETRDLSVNELIENDIKDDKGHVIGHELQSGVVYWSVTDSENGRGRMLLSSKVGNFAHNFSCGYYIVLCGINLSVIDAGAIQLLGGSNYGYASGNFCVNWGPGVCNGGTSTSGGGASFNWTLQDTNIVSFNTPNDQTSDSPTFYGNNVGQTGASVYAVLNGCSSTGTGNPAPVVQQPDHLSVVSDITTPYACQVGSVFTGGSMNRKVNYNILDIYQAFIVRPLSILETVDPSTTSSCNGIHPSTSYACSPLTSGNFTDTLDPGCPNTPALNNGCGFTFPQQVWEWCSPQPVSPVPLGDIGTVIVHNDSVNMGGNTTQFPTGTTFPH